jgi:mRNA-degrading endonuclease toxin of MazEF toxin-antitoxin module
VLVASGHAGLPKDWVANVSQIVALDHSVFTERAGRLPEALLQLVLAGIGAVLGR